jgi:hypothetical protein
MQLGQVREANLPVALANTFRSPKHLISLKFRHFGDFSPEALFRRPFFPQSTGEHLAALLSLGKIFFDRSFTLDSEFHGGSVSNY